VDESRPVVRARVVKGGRVVIAPSIYSAQETAQDIVTQARRQAEALLAGAQADAEDVRAQARQTGRQEGLAQVTELLVAARVQAEALRRQAVTSLVPLAIRVAEKVLGREIQMRPELVETQVIEALDQVSWCRRIVIRVAPEDLDILKRRRSDLMARLPEASLDLIGDPEITRGGCLIDSEAGQIDATLETQLAAIERTLLEGMNE